MRPIVLATDGSASAEPAVQRAIELATETHAPLLVMTVWDAPYTGLGYAPLPLVVDVRAEMLERSPQIVEAVALRARAAGGTKGASQPAACREAVLDKVCVRDLPHSFDRVDADGLSFASASLDACRVVDHRHSRFLPSSRCE